MGRYLKILLIICGAAYFISPLDIIPDQILPFVGWLDDGLIIATIIYMLKYGKFPSFFFKRDSSKIAKEFEKAQTQFNSQNKTTGNQDKTTSEKLEKTPWEILGVPPNATKKEIQSAYKAAIKKYHPDKVSHLGKEFSQLANDKFVEIQKAYDFLMKHM